MILYLIFIVRNNSHVQALTLDLVSLPIILTPRDHLRAPGCYEPPFIKNLRVTENIHLHTSKRYSLILFHEKSVHNDTIQPLIIMILT